jgi:hypothetical protein
MHKIECPAGCAGQYTGQRGTNIMSQISTTNINGQELSQLFAESDPGDTIDSMGSFESEVPNAEESELNTGEKLPETALEDDTNDTALFEVSQEKTSIDGACDANDTSDTTYEDITTLSLPEPPLDSFHPAIKEAILDIARCKRCPVEVPLSAFLAIAAGLVGRSRVFCIKSGWDEPGNLFLGLVAFSSTGKSPGQSMVFKPVNRIEKTSQEKFSIEKEEYERNLIFWQKAKDPDLPKPQPPIRKDIILDDWTIESVSDSLLSNPKGVLLTRDELAGLFMDLDKYSGEKGSTKTKLMSAYDANKPWKTTRVSADRNCYVPKPCVSIYGGIQPAVVCKIFSDQDQFSGFLGRFDFIQAVQKEPAIFTIDSESKQTLDAIDKLCNGLDKLSLDLDGESKRIKVTATAKDIYAKWHNKVATESWYSSDETETSLLSKIRARGLRICLLLHCMDSVLDGKNEMTPVSDNTMDRALALMDWLRIHTQATWRMLKKVAQAPTGVDMRIAQAIICLQDQIKDGWLSTQDITNQVNLGQDKRFYISTYITGRTCANLGLERKATSSARGFMITPKDISRLINLLPSNQVPQVSYVSQPNTGELLKGDTSKKIVSQVSQALTEDDTAENS